MKDEIWWKITATWNDIENLSALLFEYGAQGLHITGAAHFECFISGTNSELLEFTENIRKLGVQSISSEKVENKNWLEKCEEVWQPVPIGSLRILPLMEADAKKADNKNDILIIPGQGFGTGHHASTRFAIELMQTINNFPPDSKMLDVGCGSGILALAGSKLFETVVDAIDNDPIAIANAKENFSLNITNEINISETPLPQIRGAYGLITANIYAEVLIGMKEDFKRLLSDKGYLILSGIMSHLLDSILSNFSNPDWQVINKKDSGEWAAVLLQKS